MVTGGWCLVAVGWWHVPCKRDSQLSNDWSLCNAVGGWWWLGLVSGGRWFVDGGWYPVEGTPNYHTLGPHAMPLVTRANC